MYNGWYQTGEAMKASNVSYAADALKKHAERWDYGDCIFFAAAYVVDPEFIEHDQSSNTEVKEGFMATLEKIAILLKVRTLAEDTENGTLARQWRARRDEINKNPLAQKTWDNYPSYPDAKDADVKQFCTAANQQLTTYRNKRGIFAREWVMDSAKQMPAHLWWDENGGSVPELQAFARMVLAQPASASICERINSEFEFVKDRRRNRLCHEKANKLVGLFHNLRLLPRMKKPDYAEPAIAWADEDDDSTKSRVVKYCAKSAAGPSKLLALL